MNARIVLSMFTILAASCVGPGLGGDQGGGKLTVSAVTPGEAFGALCGRGDTGCESQALLAGGSDGSLSSGTIRDDEATGVPTIAFTFTPSGGSVSVLGLTLTLTGETTAWRTDLCGDACGTDGDPVAASPKDFVSACSLYDGHSGQDQLSNPVFVDETQKMVIADFTEEAADGEPKSLVAQCDWFYKPGIDVASADFLVAIASPDDVHAVDADGNALPSEDIDLSTDSSPIMTVTYDN